MTITSFLATVSDGSPLTHFWTTDVGTQANPGIAGVGGPGTLWREVSIGGVYIPSLMAVFVLCVGVTWLLDLGIARLGAYRFIWHPPLFRVSLFTCVFALASVTLYG